MPVRGATSAPCSPLRTKSGQVRTGGSYLHMVRWPPGGEPSAGKPPSRSFPKAAERCCVSIVRCVSGLSKYEGRRVKAVDPGGVVSSFIPPEKDLRSDIWLKLLGNVAFNPVSVLGFTASLCRGRAGGPVRPIPGLRERWGRDVVHCPFCFGWELRDQPLAVLAISPQAAAQALLPPPAGPAG